MSQGTSYTRQCYKVDESFPIQWINTKWKEDYQVTSMTTFGSYWCVIMSRNTGLSDQVIISTSGIPSGGSSSFYQNCLLVICMRNSHIPIVLYLFLHVLIYTNKK